uniref:Uncharacterized protein n=1 Tax=Balaenoptera musculus TaxID=9771 RepID=A0A8C0DPY2_BALMU
MIVQKIIYGGTLGHVNCEEEEFGRFNIKILGKEYIEEMVNVRSWRVCDEPGQIHLKPPKTE